MQLLKYDPTCSVASKRYCTNSTLCSGDHFPRRTACHSLPSAGPSFGYKSRSCAKCVRKNLTPMSPPGKAWSMSPRRTACQSWPSSQPQRYLLAQRYSLMTSITEEHPLTFLTRVGWIIFFAKYWFWPFQKSAQIQHLCLHQSPFMCLHQSPFMARQSNLRMQALSCLLSYMILVFSL